MEPKKMTFWFLLAVFLAVLVVNPNEAGNRILSKSQKDYCRRRNLDEGNLLRNDQGPVFVQLKETERIFGTAIASVRNEQARVILERCRELRKTGIVFHNLYKGSKEVGDLVESLSEGLFSYKQEDMLVREIAIQITHQDYLDAYKKASRIVLLKDAFLRDFSKSDEMAKLEAGVALVRTRDQIYRVNYFLDFFKKTGQCPRYQNEFWLYFFLKYSEPSFKVPGKYEGPIPIRGKKGMYINDRTTPHIFGGSQRIPEKDLAIARPKALELIKGLVSPIKKRKRQGFECWCHRLPDSKEPPLLLKVVSLSMIEKALIEQDLLNFLKKVSSGSKQGWQRISEAEYLKLEETQKRWFKKHPESDLVVKQEICNKFARNCGQRRKSLEASKKTREVSYSRCLKYRKYLKKPNRK